MPKKPPKTELSRVPVHVAIIMDGNGRWAQKRGLPRLAGHRAGTENLRRIIRSTVEFGVQYLTLYAFSTENWNRPRDEVEGLLHILADVIDRELTELHKEGVQLRHLGHLEHLPANLRSKVVEAIETTKNNRRLVLNLAFSYGGRDEIMCAIRKLLAEGAKPEDINEEYISKLLFTSGTPDPDLIIRTSGEMRISNFLLWQGAYAEWYFTPTLWPDFDKEEYRQALLDFAKRERRFGKVLPSPCDTDIEGNAS